MQDIASSTSASTNLGRYYTFLASSQYLINETVTFLEVSSDLENNPPWWSADLVVNIREENNSPR